MSLQNDGVRHHNARSRGQAGTAGFLPSSAATNDIEAFKELLHNK